VDPGADGLAEHRANGGVVARLYDARSADRVIDVLRDPPRRLRNDQLLWVDVTRRDAAEITRLAEVFRLHPTTAASLLEPVAGRHPVRHDAYLHVALRSPEERDGRLEMMPVDLVAASNVVITVRDGPVSAFERVRGEIEHTTQVGRLDTATFTTVLVEAILDSYLLLVEALERRIDRLDDRALRARDPIALLADLVELRSRAADLRRVLAPYRQVFSALARPDLAQDASLGRPWPELGDRLEITLAAIESARELLLGTYDIVMTRVAHRTNDTMKLLTALSAVLLPASLVAGILGMNFELPLFADPGNFWLVTAAMVALMVGTVAIIVVRDRR
jgi:Mg2+ and Co2+ transporter CorA